MSSGQPPGSKWDANQKILLGICLFFAVAFIIGLIQAFRSGARHTDIAAGFFCFSTFIAPFAIGLAWSRYKQRARAHKRDRVFHRGLLPEGYAEISFSATEHLPAICVCCGQNTTRTTKLKQRAIATNSNANDWRRVHPLLMIFLVWKYLFVVIGVKLIEILERFKVQRNSKSKDYSFYVPHCGPCARQYPVILRQVDFHGRKLTLAACPSFIKALHDSRKNR